MSEQVFDPNTGQAIPVEVVEGGPNDPFAPKDSAGTSEPVPQGTTQEPVNPTPEGNAQPAPTAPAVSEPQPDPGVTIIGPPSEITSPAKVVPATAPAPAAAPTAAPASPDLAPLAAWMQEQQHTTEEALRQQQSTYDRQASTLRGEIESSGTQMKALTEQVREMGLRDLTPEEQQTARDRFTQEDKTSDLTSWEKDLTGFHDDLQVQSVLNDYTRYGVTEEMLRGCDSPEEMEILARDAQIDFLTKNGAPAPTETPQTAPVTEAPQAAPVVPATAAIPAAPEAQVPPGATAPTDIGVGGRAPATKQFNEETNPDAMKENLANTGWQTLQLPGF